MAKITASTLPFIDWIFVTPKDAENYVNNDPTNKNRSRNYPAIRRLASDIRNNNWNYQNVDPIIIEDNGHIENGYKRLLAIISTNTPLFLPFQNNRGKDVDPELYKSLDSGSMRPISVKLDGRVRYHQQIPALSKLSCALEDNNASLASALRSTKYISHTDAINKALIKEDLFAECVRIGKDMSKVTMDKGAAAYAAFYYLVCTFDDPITANQFVLDFINKSNNNGSTKKCIKYLNDRYKKIDTDGRPSKTWIIGALLQAYEAYANGNVPVRMGSQTKFILAFDQKIAAWLKTK